MLQINMQVILIKRIEIIVFIEKQNPPLKKLRMGKKLL